MMSMKNRSVPFSRIAERADCLYSRRPCSRLVVLIRPNMPWWEPVALRYLKLTSPWMMYDCNPAFAEVDLIEKPRAMLNSLLSRKYPGTPTTMTTLVKTGLMASGRAM